MPIFNRSTVQSARVLICFMLLANSVGLISQEADKNGNSGVLIAHGVLSRNGMAGSLWTLKPELSLKFRDETILEVTFTTKVGPTSHVYDPYDGKFVELAGEVKSVFHGNAVLNKVRSIGVVGFPGVRVNPAAVPSTRSSAPNPINRTPYRHAYYLFLADVPTGCQACYVPLLVTPTLSRRNRE